jgi:hypothetical protein
MRAEGYITVKQARENSIVVRTFKAKRVYEFACPVAILGRSPTKRAYHALPAMLCRKSCRSEVL